MGYQHIHQCSKCHHTWICDDSKCGGNLHVKDERCLPKREGSMVTLPRVQRDMLYATGRRGDVGLAHKRRLERLAQ